MFASIKIHMEVKVACLGRMWIILLALWCEDHSIASLPALDLSCALYHSNDLCLGSVLHCLLSKLLIGARILDSRIGFILLFAICWKQKAYIIDSHTNKNKQFSSFSFHLCILVVCNCKNNSNKPQTYWVWLATWVLDLQPSLSLAIFSIRSSHPMLC